MPKKKIRNKRYKNVSSLTLDLKDGLKKWFKKKRFYKKLKKYL